MRAPVIVAAGAAVLAAGAVVVYLMQPAEPEPRAAAPSPAPAAPRTPAPAPAAAAPAAEPARPRTPRPAPVTPEAAPPPTVEAAPTTATLVIEADVPGATVLFDRVGVGTAPVTIPDVTPGTHRLNVSAPGFDQYAETIEVEPGQRTITVSFREIRINSTVDIVHKHGMGSCRGRLVASPDGVRYEAADGKDSFAVPFADVQSFELDYLAKNVRLRTRQGRTYNFTESAGNLDKVAYFQQDVEKVRKRLASR